MSATKKLAINLRTQNTSFAALARGSDLGERTSSLLLDPRSVQSPPSKRSARPGRSDEVSTKGGPGFGRSI